jgi:hypothetical protein
VTRRTAAVVGAAVWVVAMVTAASLPEADVRSFLVWGAVAAVVIATSIVVARTLSGLLTRAVMKDRTP